MSFQFKQFTVNQDQCAMKIGTDGVLLGAWTPIDNHPQNILDIGTGTGIIALMLAQRSDAQQIDAIEIDEDAYEQATENFENAPWNNRLFCFHAGLDELMDEPEELYDLIVSNPPFFSETVYSDNPQRDMARFQDALPFEHLLEGVALLLADNGIFAVIVPYKEAPNFIAMASTFDLYPQKITHVKGHANAAFKRSLIAFSTQKAENLIENDLIIEISRHQYTPEYIALTRDFYLKM